MSPEEELRFWQEVDALVKPVVPVIIEYRLHYNDLGEIITCSMIDHPDELTQYLVVDEKTYHNYFRYSVVKGMLKVIEFDSRYSVQLKKSDSGFAVVKDHAGLLIEPNETYKGIEYYDRIN